MYHRFVRSKKPDSHSVENENENQHSRSVNLDLAAYTRSRPTIEDIMLYQSHRLTPIPSTLLSKAGPIKSDDMAGLDQSSSPDISQYCDIDFDNISPPADIDLDDMLDEEFFASLAIPKVLVSPKEPSKEQQQIEGESPLPSYSRFVYDFPSSINLEENQKNCQENINISTQPQKSHKKHKKDGRKKKDKKKKEEQESKEVKEAKVKEEAKETMEAKETGETGEAKETKEQKKKKKKKRKEGSKKKDHKESTDYTTTTCEDTKTDIPIYNHGTITIDRNPYPVWSTNYSLYSTNMCSTNAKADTIHTPASAIPSTTVNTMWQKPSGSKPAISPKLPDPSSSDEFQGVYYQYNDITNVLAPTVEPSTLPQRHRGDLIKEVAQEVQSYFNHPTVASTAGIGAKMSNHWLKHAPSANPQQQHKKDIQSIINKYCPQNQDSQVYCPKPPRAPKKTCQGSGTLVDNTPVRKFGRIIHCNPTVQLTSTLKPSPPDNIINPHPPASSQTSNALHPPSAKDEQPPARQPHPPTSKPRPPTARQCPLTFKPQPPSGTQCPSTSGPRPPTAHQRPPTSRPRPPTASQRPPTSKQRPPTARQGPLTSKPPTGSQCPSTSRQRPPTAHQRPLTSKQRPTTAKLRPPSSIHRPPMAKMVLLQPQKSDCQLIEDETAQLPQLSPSQTEPEEPSSPTSLKPNPPSMPQQLNRAFYKAKIAQRLKCVQPGGRVSERRGHQF